MLRRAAGLTALFTALAGVGFAFGLGGLGEAGFFAGAGGAGGGGGVRSTIVTVSGGTSTVGGGLGAARVRASSRAAGRPAQIAPLWLLIHAIRS